MLTGPPPKFHGTRDILNSSADPINHRRQIRAGQPKSERT